MRLKSLTMIAKVVNVYRESGLKGLTQAFFYLIRRAIGKRTLKFSFGDIEVEMSTPPYGLYKSLRYLYDTELPIYNLLLSDLRPADVFWDVGAHLGMYTLPVGKYLRDGRVVAFEPDPVAAKFLKKNVSLNKLRNVFIVEKALCDRNGDGFFDPKLGRISDKSDKGVQVVECTRGETLVNGGKVPSPDVVKIDVEGGELEVVHGLGNLLHKIRVMIIEVHPTKGAKVDDLKKILRKTGFNLYTFGSRKYGAHETFWIRAVRDSEQERVAKL